jgi:hypothetical protein
MNLDFYKLSEQPFGVTPDPRYLYLSRTHREALESLQHGITAEGALSRLSPIPAWVRPRLCSTCSVGREGGKAMNTALGREALRRSLKDFIDALAISQEAQILEFLQ